MKKILTVVVLAAGLLFASNVNAQSKLGYISLETMVRIMPDAAKIDSILERYQADTINPQYAQIVQLYQYKDSIYRDSVHKAPPAVKKQIEAELPNLINQIQNWQQITQQALQNKQQELLEPIYRKVDTAIKAVAKENGYAYVFNSEALLVMPPGDDLLPLVAKKLNVKVPPPTASVK